MNIDDTVSESDSDDDRQEYYSLFLNSLITTIIAITTGLYNKLPYHRSILSGQGWVLEMMCGHPEYIRCELGVHLHVFEAILSTLRELGYQDSRHVKLEEQLAIFLYASVTGLSIRHLGGRFQRSNDTISVYFKKMLFAFSSPPFYTRYVRLPLASDPTPSEIFNNPKQFPFFQDVIGAIDGSHFLASSSAEGRHHARNRKGLLTQNCLLACSFDLRFTYISSGWEGSASDAVMYSDARLADFRVPEGKYYLADGGFASCDELLVPYRRVRYHLAEWGRADLRPVNKEELFNLRHASARNVVERIFGVVKKRFRLLALAPEYDATIQARIPPALCALHNFIRLHDPDEISEYTDDVLEIQLLRNDDDDTGELAVGPPTRQARTRANQRRDRIATEMWDSYQEYLRERGDEVVRE
jgi:hypothetical protein